MNLSHIQHRYSDMYRCFTFTFFNDREGLPHGLAVSGTKFNISKVEVKDYAYKFFCHFIYGSQQFTAYIKLECPGERSFFDEMVIIDLLLS